MIHHGDCLDVMAAMEPESVDAIVTDPPYGLEFMGKEWDRLGAKHELVTDTNTDRSHPFRAGTRRVVYGDNVRSMQAWHSQWAEAAYRVAKPSAYLLAFGGTRTVHRLTCALEDAGWIIRDMLVWAYASGFPKSKASLKPAWEPIVMARKPGPLRELAIDACRIGVRDESQMYVQPRATTDRAGASWSKGEHVPFHYGESGGRWPANVILTDPIFDGGVEGVVGGGETAGATSNGKRLGTGYGEGYGQMAQEPSFADSGTYSRFFLIPKADRSDREPTLPEPLVLSDKEWRDLGFSDGAGTPRRRNVHPTVKPVDLMRHLVRLVTPAGGTVLDPFLGSGTTAIAAEMEGFPWVGIEREAEYVAIAEARLNGVQKGLGLSA